MHLGSPVLPSARLEHAARDTVLASCVWALWCPLDASESCSRAGGQGPVSGWRAGMEVALSNWYQIILGSGTTLPNRWIPSICSRELPVPVEHRRSLLQRHLLRRNVLHFAPGNRDRPRYLKTPLHHRSLIELKVERELPDLT
jgi:hypothetical protein